MAFTLEGANVLVVEDEYLIAAELSKGLREAGAVVAGPAPSLDAAIKIAAEAPLDAAVLDINLRGQMVYPLVDTLMARNIPIVLATGYDASAIPARYARLVRCEKPISLRAIEAAISKAHKRIAPHA